MNTTAAQTPGRCATRLQDPSTYGYFELTEGERDIFGEHLFRLDEKGRYTRFGGLLTDELLKTVIARYPLERTTFGLIVWGELRGAASVIPTGQGRGEFAISLLPSLQGRGHGRFMTYEAMRMAFEAGLREVDIQYLTENRAMARIAARYPGKLEMLGAERVKSMDLEAWAAGEGIWLGQAA